MKPEETPSWYVSEMVAQLQALDTSQIDQCVKLLLDAHKNKKQIFIVGNGGSASTASHFACDLGKGTVNGVKDDHPRFKAISLTDNVAVMSAYSNDVSYDEVFSQQLRNLVQEQDIVIGISASGNSENIIRALKVAKDHNAHTIGFVGFEGGRMKDQCDTVIHVQHDDYGVVEDVHSCLQHMICTTIRHQFQQENPK